MILGVTGSMGCGKTYVCERLVEAAHENGMHLHYLNVDDARRYILGDAPEYLSVRQELSDRFGMRLNDDTSIGRQGLSRRLFSGDSYDRHADMSAFRDIVYPVLAGYIMERRRDNMLIEWALLAEDGMLPLVDYNVLLVTCDDQTQFERLAGGDLPSEQLMKRIDGQLSNVQKAEMILSAQESVGYGKMTVFDTTGNPGKDSYRSLLDGITSCDYRYNEMGRITEYNAIGRRCRDGKDGS